MSHQRRIKDLFEEARCALLPFGFFMLYIELFAGAHRLRPFSMLPQDAMNSVFLSPSSDGVPVVGVR